MVSDLFRREKRTREAEPIVINDDDEDDDELEVKPQHNSIFKTDEDDEIEELLQNELLENFDPGTWGMERQSS
jgi:hypothetical protein